MPALPGEAENLVESEIPGRLLEKVVPPIDVPKQRSVGQTVLGSEEQDVLLRDAQAREHGPAFGVSYRGIAAMAGPVGQEGAVDRAPFPGPLPDARRHRDFVVLVGEDAEGSHRISRDRSRGPSATLRPASARLSQHDEILKVPDAGLAVLDNVQELRLLSESPQRMA